MDIVELGIGDEGRLRLVRDPFKTLDAHELDCVRHGLQEIARAGFGIDDITERDVTIAALSVAYGGFVDVAGELVGNCTAAILAPTGLRAPVLYVGGALLAPHAQRRGYYRAMLLARFALGVAAGCTYFTTRTQSPVVCRSLRPYSPYPFTTGSSSFRPAARAIARQIHDDWRRRAAAGPGAMDFDDVTGVLHHAYPYPLYREMQWSGDADIDSYFRANVAVDQGDALIVVGPLKTDELDGPSRDVLELSFEDLVERVSALLH